MKTFRVPASFWLIPCTASLWFAIVNIAHNQSFLAVLLAGYALVTFLLFESYQDYGKLRAILDGDMVIMSTMLHKLIACGGVKESDVPPDLLGILKHQLPPSTDLPIDRDNE